MIFYEICTRKIKTENSEKNTVKKKCREASDVLYRNYEENIFATVSDMSEFKCTLAVAVKAKMARNYTAEILVEEFNKISELDLTVKSCKEISLRQFKHFLHRAEYDEYIEDERKIILELNLECDCRYKELVAKDFTKSQIEELAQELLYDKSLQPEIDRIYQVKNESQNLHHPVHYIIRSDNEDDCHEIIDCLLSALCENNRLFSKRYSELEVYDRMDCSIYDLFRLYSVQRGGTVVLKIKPSRSAESVYEINRLCEHIERMSRAINKFNQDVLTILVLPQVCERETEIIYKYAEPVFVEILPENASGERAKKYLDYKARKAEVTVTDTLYKGINDERALNCNELSEHFNTWFSNYIRMEMYPQYAELKKKITVENNNQFGKALRDLNEMVGLKNVKKIIFNTLDYYKVQKMYKQLGKKTENPSMHMVFTGNPGTAKTTVARLFTQILKDNDIITNGRLVEVGRADLIGKYVGHTAPLVRQAFEKAAGGVLFIDEAYSLLDDKSGMYGDEAINTIVQEMENRRNETIVIFAGYPDEMEEFLSRNPGLKSRIAFYVPFEDYSPADLVEITKIMAHNKENIIDESALDKLNDIFSDAVKINNFGNGRYARNIIERAEMSRATRIAKLNFADVTSEMLRIFIADDFKADTAHKPEERTMGFI